MARKARKLDKTVECSDGGWRAVVYTDDDGASGYGDHAMFGYWYGTKEECEAVDPRTVTLYPMTDDDGPDSFDMACERRFD